jgi:DNA replication protein DnaC
METMGSELTKLAQALQDTRQEDHHHLRVVVEQAGGAAAWLNSLGLGGHPADLTEQELLAETSAFWQAAARREQSCQRCPEHGGACAAELGCLPPGSYLAWIERRPRAQACQRWTEHELRQRLAEAGVPFRLQGCRADTFQVDTDQQHQAHLEVGELVKLWTKSRELHSGSPWIVLCGSHGTGKSHLLAAALRTVRRLRPAFHVWYQDATELASLLQNFFDNRDTTPDPMERLAETSLLAFDNVDPGSWKPWLQKSVEELLVQRWNRGLATLLATHQTPDALLQALRSLTELRSGAAWCTLG